MRQSFFALLGRIPAAWRIRIWKVSRASLRAAFWILISAFGIFIGLHIAGAFESDAPLALVYILFSASVFAVVSLTYAINSIFPPVQHACPECGKSITPDDLSDSGSLVCPICDTKLKY
jgi:hypothetical protein